MSAEEKFLENFQRFCFEFYEMFMNAYIDFKNKNYKTKEKHLKISSERDLLDANGMSHAVYHEGMRYFKGNIRECRPDHHPAIILTDRGLPLKWQFAASPAEDHYVLHVAVHCNSDLFEKNMGKTLEKVLKKLKKKGLFEDFR